MVKRTEAQSVATSIFAHELDEFEGFLAKKGIKDFSVSPDRQKKHLVVTFENPPEIMKYKLANLEAQYKMARSNTYYWDLDQEWDANSFFGEE